MQIAEILKSLWRLYSNENGDFQVSRGCYQKHPEGSKSSRRAPKAVGASTRRHAQTRRRGKGR